MATFTVHYYAATYHGRRVVNADDAEDAVRKVRRFVRQNMSLPMYADGYRECEGECGADCDLSYASREDEGQG